VYYKYAKGELETDSDKDAYHNKYDELATDPVYTAEIKQIYIWQKALIPDAPSLGFSLKKITMKRLI